MKLLWRRKNKTRRKPKPMQARLHEITPPEGVPLRFEVAGIGARFGAQLTDIALCLIAVLAIVLLLAVGMEAPQDLVVSIAAISFFMIRAPYYILTELLWNGATLGKRFMKIRVLAADGKGLTVHSVVTRNLMKEAEIFAPGTMLVVASDLDGWSQAVTLFWIAVVLSVPLFNKRRQRLGDMIAGTYVIQRPVALLAPDLAAEKVEKTEAMVFQPHQLEHYGAYELQTLEKVLQARLAPDAPRAARERREATLTAIIDRIRAKIDYGEPVRPEEAEAFLRAFYNAQRAHLEQRQLFGDKRADKHHAEAE